jgi:salicylate hydroxylase
VRRFPACRPPMAARPAGRITFLGDAIHAMSPAGGEGANTAMADAAALVTCISRHGPDGVAEYERGLRERATTALRRSQDYGRRPGEVPAHA